MRASCVRSSYAFICLLVNNTASARPSNFLVNLPRRIPRRPKALRGEAELRRGPIKASAPARGEGTKDIASCVDLLAPTPYFAAIIKHIISYRTIPYLCFTVAPPSSRQVGVMPSQAKPPPAAANQSCTNSNSVQTKRGRGVERHRDDGQRLFPERPLLTLPLSWLAPISMPTPCRSRLMIIIVRRAWRRLVWLLDCGRGLGHYQI